MTNLRCLKSEMSFQTIKGDAILGRGENAFKLFVDWSKGVMGEGIKGDDDDPVILLDGTSSKHIFHSMLKCKESDININTRRKTSGECMFK